MNGLLDVPHRMKSPPGRSARLNQWSGPFQFRPLNPGEYINNGDGSRSTEYSRTIPVNVEGEWTNVPSIWMTPDGAMRFDSEDDVLELMKMHEKTGVRFPRFKSIGEAEAAARARSNAGGVFSGLLAQ